jgi:hypothetical protein
MSDTMFDLGRRHSELCDADPVVKLARAREQALEAWGEAQEEADRIMAALVARRSGWERSGNQDGNPVSRHRHDCRGVIVAQAELRF